MASSISSTGAKLLCKLAPKYSAIFAKEDEDSIVFFSQKNGARRSIE
jgi:hypothetical protein